MMIVQMTWTISWVLKRRRSECWHAEVELLFTYYFYRRLFFVLNFVKYETM